MTHHTLRLGKINYTNVLPVDYFLRRHLGDFPLKMLAQTPAELNRNMAAGNIDLGPMSSFAYAERESDYVVLPDLSISAQGKVRSIYLFCKRPLEELKEPRIALTNTSATSVALLKIILEKFYERKPVYETMPPSIEKMLQAHDGALLIGDDALRASWNPNGYIAYDLGELWYKETGYAMTFALWAVRRDVARRFERETSVVYRALCLSKKEGRERIREIISHVCERFGGSSFFWNVYYNGLDYDLTPRHLEGLHYYYRCACELGLLASPVKVRRWTPPENRGALSN